MSTDVYIAVEGHDRDIHLGHLGQLNGEYDGHRSRFSAYFSIQTLQMLQPKLTPTIIELIEAAMKLNRDEMHEWRKLKPENERKYQEHLAYGWNDLQEADTIAAHLARHVGKKWAIQVD